MDTGGSFPTDFKTRANDAVTRANFVFKPAGVQFYVQSMEAYVAHRLYDNLNIGTLSWAAVWSEFSQFFPAATSTTFASYGLQSVKNWFAIAAEKWAEEDSIFVYLVDGSNAGRFPFEARHFEMNYGQMNATPVFAHELGHHLGLGHPFILGDDNNNIHPETGANLKLADWWDFSYIQGVTSNIYPTSRAQAITAGTNLKRINNNLGGGAPPDSYCQKFQGYPVYKDLSGAAIPSGTCSHHICNTGAALASGCNACVSSTFCTNNPDCCTTSWTAACVTAAETACGANCNNTTPSCSTRTCSHPLGTVGAALTNICSPCATQVCGVSPSCCSTGWDLDCVKLAKSLCNCTFQGSNCCMDGGGTVLQNSSGIMKCEVGQPGYAIDAKSTGDVGMDALGITTAEANTPPASHKYGDNVMDYTHGYVDFPVGISQSQAKMIRAYLRHEITITQGVLLGKPSRMTKLGQYRNHQPAYVIDLDGDGRRDLVQWAPVGAGGVSQFRVFLSNGGTSYSTSFTISLGQVGDVPALGDYNGDGLTDLAVYRPGGTGAGAATDPSTWIYCPTTTPAASTTCATPLSVTFGERAEVPVLNTDFISAAPELAVYRPSTGDWKWRTIGSSTVTTVNLGGRAHTNLAGLYDDDTLTDLAVYNPATAKFSMKLSGSSWGTQIDRQFNTAYIPTLDGGTPQDRSAAMAIPGMYKNRLRGSSYYNRLGLVLWDPSTGEWQANWEPVTGTTTQTCQFGVPYDIPLSSVGTTFTSSPIGVISYSHWAVFRPDSNPSNNGYLYSQPSAGSTCGTPNSGISMGSPPFNYQIFTVGDMNLDNKPEIWQYSPDLQKLYCYYSSGYTSSVLYDLGWYRSYLL